RSARLELTEVDVRDRRRQRVASQRRKALRRAAKNQQRITAGVSDADQQLGELSGVPQVASGQGRDCPLQADRLGRREIAFAVAGQQVQGVPAARGYDDVGMAATAEVAGANEIGA